MSGDTANPTTRSTRFHIITNPPPEAIAIVQSLRRLWPKKVGKRGISKNEVRGIIQRVGKAKLGATDDIVRCLNNGGVILSSLEDGADIYYIDPVRSLEILELLKGGVRSGYSEQTPEYIDQRRIELRRELAECRGKESTSAFCAELDAVQALQMEKLEQDMRRLAEEMEQFSLGGGS